MDVQIGPFQSSDTQAVRKVVLDGLKEFDFEYTPEFDYDLDDPKAHYLNKGGMFFVLKVDGKVVGTVAIINRGDVAELKRLYVEKQYQGQGLGSQLLDTAIQYCQKEGFNKIEFETNKKFTKAHILYEKRGFKTVREDKGSYYMEKELDTK